MPRNSRSRRPDDLHGPTPKVVPYVPPDLGLHPDKENELWTRVQHLRNRWRPLTEDPNNLTRELYEILEWLLSEEPPGPGVVIR